MTDICGTELTRLFDKDTFKTELNLPFDKDIFRTELTQLFHIDILKTELTQLFHKDMFKTEPNHLFDKEIFTRELIQLFDKDKSLKGKLAKTCGSSHDHLKNHRVCHVSRQEISAEHYGHSPTILGSTQQGALDFHTQNKNARYTRTTTANSGHGKQTSTHPNCFAEHKASFQILKW